MSRARNVTVYQQSGTGLPVAVRPSQLTPPAAVAVVDSVRTVAPSGPPTVAVIVEASDTVNGRATVSPTVSPLGVTVRGVSPWSPGVTTGATESMRRLTLVVDWLPAASVAVNATT